MGGLSLWHWLILIGVAMILFGGRGRLSDIMGDVAQGIKSFKKGLTEADNSEIIIKPNETKPYDEKIPPKLGS